MKQIKVILETDLGSIDMYVCPEWAPQATLNFIGLVRQKMYDNSSFHRTAKNFMIQGGIIPNVVSLFGTKFPDEFTDKVSLATHIGLVGMANNGPNTNGTQFFITTRTCPWLVNKHTIFGFVDDLTVVKLIEAHPHIKINRVYIDQEIE